MNKRRITDKDRADYCKAHICSDCYFNGDDCMIETWKWGLADKVPKGKVVRFKTEVKV